MSTLGYALQHNCFLCARSSKVRLRPTVTNEWGSQSNQIVPRGFGKSSGRWAWVIVRGLSVWPSKRRLAFVVSFHCVKTFLLLFVVPRIEVPVLYRAFGRKVLVL